jgi:hypothetical protein
LASALIHGHIIGYLDLVGAAGFSSCFSNKMSKDTTPSSSLGISPSTAHTSPGDDQEYQNRFLKGVETVGDTDRSDSSVKPTLKLRDSNTTVTDMAQVDSILPEPHLRFDSSQDDSSDSTIAGVTVQRKQLSQQHHHQTSVPQDQKINSVNSESLSDVGVSDTSTTPEDSDIVFTKKTITQESARSAAQTTSAFSSFSSQAGRSTSTYRHKHRTTNTANGAAILGTSCECNSPPLSPPVLSNDQSRIQTPASTLPPSMSSSLEIGAHMPFTDSGDSKNTNNSGIHNNSNLGSDNNLQATALRASLSQLELTLPSLGNLRQSKAQNYQPARVVLQRNLSNIAGSKINLGDNATVGSTTSNSTLTGSGTAQQSRENFPYIGMKQDLINSQSTISLPASPSKGQGLFSTPAHTTFSHDSGDSIRSTRSSFQGQPLRQLRDPRTPLYMPAVLRRTTTYDNLGNDNDTNAANLRPSTLPVQLIISRPPPQDHWKPDSSRDACKDCSLKFTLFERRHHCRRCGEIFCSEHSKYKVGLDQGLNFSAFGYPSRACSHCAIEYQMQMNEDEQQRIMEQSTESIAVKKKLNNNNSTTNEPVVGSVPADWSWSTF